MRTAPERIWLEDEAGEGDPAQWEYGIWDCRNFAGYVHEYIRADIYAAALAREAVLREALEDAEYDLAQWLECGPELIKAGFNMDGTADVLTKVSAALQAKP